MRVVARRVYRAFPELDRYSDEQCARFVRSARSSPGLVAMHWMLVLIAFGGSVVGAFYGASVIAEMAGVDLQRFDIRPEGRINRGAGDRRDHAPCGSAGGAAHARCAAARADRKRFLRERGVCPSCRYMLLGLPIAAGNTVVCPECGLACDVDPSLGELTLDDAGQARFHPSHAMSGARRARMAEHGRGLERAARVLVYGGGAAAAVWVLSIFVRFAFWIPTRCLVGLGGGSVSVVWFGGAAGPRASPFGQTYAFRHESAASRELVAEVHQLRSGDIH